MSAWYKKSFRRNLVDMHIEDWDEVFLSRLDPKVYVERLKTAQVQSAMIYANSHVGYSYWPTKVGHMHRGLKGRDFFKEVTGLCQQEGIDVIAYYTLIFVNWPYEQHPEWRMRTADGKGSRDLRGTFLYNGRYGIVCPNNLEYRAFVKAQVEEILASYHVKGFFFDMIFWPFPCYCDACKERYRKETGAEIPTVIDASDPNFLTFMKKREEWLLDIALFSRKLVKDHDPDLTVEHNASITLTDAVDFSAGDNYGDMDTQNLTAKLMNSVSPNLPFEFMTSRCYPSLFAHTSVKPKEMLELESSIALANGGAFFFIDAINPDGTINPKPYEIMGEIFGRARQYEPYRGGEIHADIAVYKSETSDIDFSALNGQNTFELTQVLLSMFTGGKQTASAVAATRILKENHIPYTVIRRQNLKDFGKYQVVVLPNISFLDPQEEAAILNWVNEGGRVYISGGAHLNLVSRLLGATYEGMTGETMTYLVPTQAGQFMVEGTTNDADPVSIMRAQPKIKLAGSGTVLATIGVPYTDPLDPTKFATIHANPPGYNTGVPAIVHARHGKGEVIWSAVPLEERDSAYETNCAMFARLVRKLAAKPFAFQSSSSPYVDITLFPQPEKSAFLVNFVNLQEHMPVIPVVNFTVSIQVGDKQVKKVCLLPDEKELAFSVRDGTVQFTIEQLRIYEAAMVYYA